MTHVTHDPWVTGGRHPILAQALHRLIDYQTAEWIKMALQGTWHGGGPRSGPHCARWGPTPPPLKGHSPQFSAHVRCGQTAGWTKMPLGMEVGLGSGDFVLELDGDPARSPPEKGHSLPNFWPMTIVVKRLDG